MTRRIIWIVLAWLVFSCNKENSEPVFRLLESKDTGLDFVNKLTPTKDLNIFNYLYYYNGAGSGAGDLNNDGLIDLVFSGNQVDNKLYLNKGNLKFEDITIKSGFSAKKGWSTGVSLVDINQDGLLDIYICRVGDFLGLKGHNLLFVCKNIDKNGLPHYTEESAKYGLNLVGFGTQASFFDYDADGDLDFFLLTHSVHQNNTYNQRSIFLDTFHPLAGDRFFENIDGKYIEKTKEAGIQASAVGYGLGLALGDVNLDGYPDIYVGNDFHENDYLYINQKNKNFKDLSTQSFSNTSRFSMGVDVADLNNDIFPEIFSLDMLPYDSELLKRSDGEDAFYNFKFKLSQGYSVQFARNNLQHNNGDGTFSEVGMFAGVHATDWSWSTLLFDFQNDGLKDIYISNGISKRLNDLDYINFISNTEMQRKLSEGKIDELEKSLHDFLPEIKIPNRFYSNNGNLAFSDFTNAIKNARDSYSNGSIYADLDNDGDQDIVTNNIDDAAFLYENLSNEQHSENQTLTIDLKGPEKNKTGVGTKCIVYAGGKTFYQEKFPVHGFMSSMETPLQFGLGTVKKIDSVLVIWPDNHFEKIISAQGKKRISVSYKSNLPVFEYSKLHKENTEYKDISEEINPGIVHQENDFNDFDYQPLLPNMISKEGPALAIGDVNHDGQEDLFLGNAKGKVSEIYLQNKTGKLLRFPQPELENDSLFEDIDAQFADFNHDGHLDLAVLSGGNQFEKNSEYLRPRIYLNDGKGNFKKNPSAFSGISLCGSVLLVKDVNADGHPDLFLGARCVPFAYGEIPKSYLLINDGKGNFQDKTEQLMPGLGLKGMVKSAVWTDINQDKVQELVVAYDWGKVVAFEYKNKKYVARDLTEKSGWWNFVYPMDVNLDGKTDLICGNLGTNSRLKATENEPVKMYVNDYDQNSRLDQILTYYVGGKETIFIDKRELEKQLPSFKKKFLYYKDFAQASLEDLLGVEKIKSATIFEADFMENAVLINKGKGTFDLMPLDGKAQWAPFYAAEKVSDSGDFLMLGNFYDCNIQMGIYDADRGNIYNFSGKKAIKPFVSGGIRGQIKKIKTMTIAGKQVVVVAGNNQALKFYSKK